MELDHLMREEEVLTLTTHEAEVEMAFEAGTTASVQTVVAVLVSSLNAGDRYLMMIVLQKTVIAAIGIDLAILCLLAERARLRSSRREACRGRGAQVDIGPNVLRVQGHPSTE